MEADLLVFLSRIVAATFESHMPDSELSTLWELLGIFIFKYASAERILYLYLLTESALPIEIARANYGDARVAKAKEALIRLRKAKGLAKDPQLDRALDQLSTISRTRNDILHYGMHPCPEASIKIDDTLWKNENISKYEVKSETLVDMIGDLQTIEAYFAYAFGSMVPFKVPVFEMFREASLAPWRYKPSQPNRPPSKTAPNRGSPQLPRPSSPKKH